MMDNGENGWGDWKTLSIEEKLDIGGFCISPRKGIVGVASAFLCADLGITPEVRDDHASYIANWLTVLKNDKRAIFSAAAHAQKAVDYLHGLTR
jgi:hypothetical protein